jgi:hypothetical protein
MGEQVHIVLIETASNQAFVFQTNRLREIVGASDLIHRVGTRWAIEAAVKRGAKGPKDGLDAGTSVDLDTKGRAAYVCAEAHRIAAGSPSRIEPVVCTSGKAVFLVRDRSDGEAIVWDVTHRALEQAPGLVVRGAVSDPIDLFETADAAGKAVAALFRTIEGLRLSLPPAEARFPLQPIVQPCLSSGLPAEGMLKGDALSAGSLAKQRALVSSRKHGPGALDRVQAEMPRFTLARNPDALENKMGLDWLAVVHADGNGFGQVFLSLSDYCAAFAKSSNPTARDYFNLYRELSVSLDLVGVEALRNAAAALKPIRGTFNAWHQVTEAGEQQRKEEKIVPLVVNVMGGDDLTVICDGRQAVDFAAAFLSAFEKNVGAPMVGDRTNVIANLTAKKGVGRFGAAAGVAIVKPHHPLHRAYELAEELTRSAKSIVKHDLKDPGLSALDFQVVFGDTTSTLDDLRGGWTIETRLRRRADDGKTPAPAPADGTKDRTVHTRVHSRPYVVSPEDRAAVTARDFIRRRHYERLTDAIQELNRENGEGRPLLSRKQQHELRDALFEGRAVADARLKLIAGRYGVLWPAFGGDEKTLFAIDSAGDAQTRLLDAMDLADLQDNVAPAEAGDTSTTGADR